MTKAAKMLRKGFLPRQLYHMCTVQEMQGSNDMLAKPVYNKNNIKMTIK